jgi:hypothetical protein
MNNILVVLLGLSSMFAAIFLLIGIPILMITYGGPVLTLLGLAWLFLLTAVC